MKQPEVENTKEFLYKRYCNGIIGVPITYIYKHNPEQFSIVNANDYRKTEDVYAKPHGLIKDKEAAVKKTVYARICVRKKYDLLAPKNCNIYIRGKKLYDRVFVRKIL